MTYFLLFLGGGADKRGFDRILECGIALLSVLSLLRCVRFLKWNKFDLFFSGRWKIFFFLGGGPFSGNFLLILNEVKNGF